jgi:hypothetical protein
LALRIDSPTPFGTFLDNLLVLKMFFVSGKAGPDGVMFFEDMARRAVAQVPKPENNITPM